MNSKGIKAVTDTKICMKCLKKKASHFYSLYGRGYGSIFDEFNSKVQLCDDCNDENVKIWIEEKGKWDKEDFCGEEYEYEDKLEDFLESLPIQGRELFHNRFGTGSNALYNMEPQDWIDFELDELPHKVCKKYGFYSKEEKDAYHERFPNCKCVTITKYSDGSSGSDCHNMARGDGEGKCGLNCYNECYMCTDYEPRTSEIEIIDEVEDYYKHEKERLIHMIQYGATRLKELEMDVKTYMGKHGN